MCAAARWHTSRFEDDVSICFPANGLNLADRLACQVRKRNGTDDHASRWLSPPPRAHLHTPPRPAIPRGQPWGPGTEPIAPSARLQTDPWSRSCGSIRDHDSYAWTTATGRLRSRRSALMLGRRTWYSCQRQRGRAHQPLTSGRRRRGLCHRRRRRRRSDRHRHPSHRHRTRRHLRRYRRRHHRLRG